MAMRTKTRNFNPRAPCGARPTGTKQAKDLFEISTHAPLAGRDSRSWSNASLLAGFQPTRPLRGATVFGAVVLRMLIHFNPRAPCGARPVTKINVVTEITFQPTRPLRGATASPGGLAPTIWRNFNPRAPCGARPPPSSPPQCPRHFNPRAPCGARPLQDL